LLKLLQKAAYLAADIYDHLGIRLIFNTRFECLLALRTLQRAHLLSVTNVDSQRTRNSLLDLEAAKQVFVKYRAVLERADGYPEQLLQRMDEELLALSSAQNRTDNPHSGSGFNSLQVTIRKMIHLQADAVPDARIAEHAYQGGSGGGGEAEVGFFFEYEIQLMDKASYDRSLNGPASHHAYKQRQVDTARARVFGPQLLKLVGRHTAPAQTVAPLDMAFK
jgi:uncharacterized protein (TIGR04562 family)